MKLVKIEDGLVEHENFFSVAPFSKFLGDFEYIREDGIFTLKKGYVERRFEQEEFVVVVEKENKALQNDEGLYFYIRERQKRSGLVETKEWGGHSSRFWKIIRHKGFVQGYSSSNGITWTHRGGGEIPTTNVQGFQIEGDTNLRIRDYKVYKNPFVTVYGFNKGMKVIIEDVNGEILSSATVDENHKAQLLIEYPINGRIKVISDSGVKLFASSLMDLKYGDVFSNTQYDLQVIYQGEVLDYTPTVLNSFKEKVIVKNVSNDIYKDIHIRAILFNTDNISISLDDKEYEEGVVINKIEPDEEVFLYIHIQRDKKQLSYGIRHFALEID